MKLEERLIQLIAHSDGVIILRSEFASLGASPSQVSRIINKLIERGLIQRVSKGVFVKTKINKFTNTLTPIATLEVVAKELFIKLNIQVTAPEEVLDYNAGLTSQIPAGGAVVVIGRRITRKISVAGRSIRYVKKA